MRCSLPIYIMFLMLLLVAGLATVSIIAYIVVDFYTPPLFWPR